MANFTYIIADEAKGDAAIIDPSWNLEKIFDALKKNTWKPKYIINTHSHFDHVLGNEQVAEITGAQLVQHKNSQLKEHRYCDIKCLNEPHSTVEKFYTVNPIFICVISYTETSQIPGITMAGANSELVKYTSAADSEFLYYGHCKCINNVPATPDGKPTPAIITRSALRLTDIPFLIVDAGSKVKPLIPYISFNIKSGKNIKYANAVEMADVKKAFDYGILLGKQLTKNNDLIVIGESVPGGTTTALAVLIALGVDAKFKISSSMPENPHYLKNSAIDEGMKMAGIVYGELKDDPFRAISLFGDPMIPSVAGLTAGVTSSKGRV